MLHPDCGISMFHCHRKKEASVRIFTKYDDFVAGSIYLPVA